MHSAAHPNLLLWRHIDDRELVRSAHVALVAAGAGTLDATVQICSFLGNLSMVLLLCADGQRILAETRALATARWRLSVPGSALRSTRPVF